MVALAEASLPSTDPRAHYTPYGAVWTFLHSHAPEVVLAGPAGTGKTRGALTKLHLCAELCPGLRGLMVRKTRASLTESALVTFENYVLPQDHPALKQGGGRKNRHSYVYPNGSELVIGGMDNASRMFSTEYDLIYVQEAIELSEDDWEKLTRPLRNNRLPYQQLFGDTNPDAPRHWLKLRCDARRTLMLESRHEDNPTLWDMAKQCWTPQGADYIARLDALTGPRYWRLRKGKWVQAEGIVYEGWDPALHLVDRFPIPGDWPRFWAVDFGYNNPFVCLWFALNPDGILYCYREVYMSHRLVEDHARDMLRLSKDEPRPQAIICDTDAEDRATLEKHLGMPTRAAQKDVRPGIQAVAARLRKQLNGKSLLYLLRDSLVRVDPLLQDAKRPICTKDEFDSYCWNPNSTRKEGEEPLKENDHGMDAVRYLVAHFDLRRYLQPRLL